MACTVARLYLAHPQSPNEWTNANAMGALVLLRVGARSIFRIIDLTVGPGLGHWHRRG